MRFCFLPLGFHHLTSTQRRGGALLLPQALRFVKCSEQKTNTIFLSDATDKSMVFLFCSVFVLKNIQPFGDDGDEILHVGDDGGGG